MSQVVRLSSTLFKRLAAHAEGFQTPGDVITKILDAYENNLPGSTLMVSPEIFENTTLPSRVEIVFSPQNELTFKNLLLKKREAWVALYKNDGSCEIHNWNANRFSESSSVKGNLQSGYLRNWKKKGIIKAEVAINKEDITSGSFNRGHIAKVSRVETRHHNINLITRNLGFKQLGSSTVFVKNEQYIISPAVAAGENGQYWIDIRQANLDKVNFHECNFLIRIVPDLFCCCPLSELKPLIDQNLRDNRANSGFVWGVKLDINHTDKIVIVRSNRDQDINVSLELLNSSDIINYFDEDSFSHY